MLDLSVLNGQEISMLSRANNLIEEPFDVEPSIEERRALIERVAASTQFRRAARLREFLLYVGGQSLKEGCPEIHEQEIGAKVFGRSLNYDRSQDNIVRVNATELRKRIELYFASEGAHESLVLEIPRGGYKPIIHRRVPESRLLETHDLPAPSREPQVSADFTHHDPVAGVGRNHGRQVHLAWAAVSVALAVACVLLAQQNRTMRRSLYPWEGKPAIAAFWAGFLRYDQQTDVVLPDDSVSVVEDITQRPITLGDYLNRNFIRQIQSSNLSTDRKVDLDQIVNHNLVTFGGVRAAQQMLALIPLSYPRQLTLSRYYVADAIKRNNVILIGGKKANPWVHLFDEQMNFITDYDDENTQAFVRNRAPKPGEQAIYPVLHDANALVGYSVIAYLPNPSRAGNAIVLAGTDSDATGAAAEFLASEDQLAKLRSTLQVKDFPYFEVLLKTSRLSGTSFNSELIAYRIYPGLH
jgi:hypothetical protein